MTPAELLAKLKQLGVKLFLAGDKLHVDAPAGVLTDELKEAIRQHRAELVALLLEQDAQAWAVTRLLQERGWVAIKSSVLGEVIIWARDGVVAAPARWNRAVVYTLAELEALTSKKPDEEGLRLLHEAKKAFGGELKEM